MDNPAENAIRRIAHLSRRQGFTEAQRSRQIHLAWTSAFPHIFNKVKIVDGEERIDCAGSEHQSIVVPMQNSSQLWIAHQCQCENSDPLMRPDTVRNFGNINWSAETIGWFRTLDITIDETHPRNVIGYQNCDACKSNFRATRGYVSRSTFFHSFRMRDSSQSQEVFNFDSYPRTLEFEELETRETVYFDLAYISMGTRFVYDPVTRQMTPRLGHQTSAHLIEGEGCRYYDGMNGGALTDMPSNLHISKEITSVNYVRRVIPKSH